MFEQYSGVIRLARTMIATWLIFACGHPDRASAQTTAANQSSAAVENNDEEGTVATASLEEDAGLRLIRENIYVLRHQHLNRKEQWAAAIRTLVRIGPPAVPELIRELDRRNRSTTLRSLGFTLRAIGDPRAVPALIRAKGTQNCPWARFAT